jgi:phage tail-like protein
MHDIPVSFHFKVELLGLSSEDQDVRFREATGLAAEVTTEEFREGGLNAHVHRLPTGAKYGNLVLRRGFIKGSQVTKWCRSAIEDFVFEPKDVLVTLLDEEHSPLAQWSFAGAYPLKWSLSDLKAQENALAVESLELAYRMFRRS